MGMDCNRARELTLDFLRGTLPAGPAEEMRAHLAGCAACRAHLEAERALGEVLAAKLPRHEAPPALRRRLAADWPGAARARPVGRVRGFAVAATLAVVLAAAVGGTTAVVVEGRAQTRAVATEALNDHLRVLEGGRLDFAPALAFAGNADFPFQGGAVEPFLDRRAAIFVFKRRLHTATLFVVMADGLAFPRHLTTRTVRGFNLFLWRAGEQGYVLASDLSLPELGTLQKLIA